MIAPRKTSRCKKTSPGWQEGFLAMLPAIRRYVSFAFRRLKADAREEAIADTIARAMAAYVKLFERGKVDLAYPTVLARFAVKQYRAGRRVGSKMNSRDVLASYAQRKNGLNVERLDRYDAQEEEWVEATVMDRRTPIADQAAFRCDFPAWLSLHASRNRRIAVALSLGHSTQEVARRFHLSPGRVSQLRREFHDSWLAFHGEWSAQEVPDRPHPESTKKKHGLRTEGA